MTKVTSRELKEKLLKIVVFQSVYKIARVRLEKKI